MVKKLKKDILGLTGAGVGLGLGATVVGKTGASTAAFTEASGLMPMFPPVIGGGIVAGQLKSLKKAGKKVKIG